MMLVHSTLQVKSGAVSGKGKRLPAFVSWPSKVHTGKVRLLLKQKEYYLFMFFYFKDLVDLLRMNALEKPQPDLAPDEQILF